LNGRRASEAQFVTNLVNSTTETTRPRSSGDLQTTIKEEGQSKAQNSTPSNGKVTCDRCETAQATKKCVECAVPLCDTCTADLHKKGKWVEHNIVAIEPPVA
jgi:late competence protein required for DNA uptake (superfamily II DNA/RNA helicase)